jgi:PAS domain S-box-containing protein
MLTPAANPAVHWPLRHHAEALIQAGTPPRAKVATTGAEALALLHDMSTDPRSASAVVKLLHELQVHQVELDLQHEQLEQSREELTHALGRYVERFDFAPVGYVAADRDGKIIDGNLAAADLFGVEQAALSGRRIDSLVTSETRLALLAMLKRLSNGGSRETCEAKVNGGGGVLRLYQVVATVSPSDQTLMLVFVETVDRKVLDPRT